MGLAARASRDHTLAGFLWKGFRESRRCSRDPFPESYITEYVLIYEDKPLNPKQSVKASVPPSTFIAVASVIFVNIGPYGLP